MMEEAIDLLIANIYTFEVLQENVIKYDFWGMNDTVLIEYEYNYENLKSSKIRLYFHGERIILSEDLTDKLRNALYEVFIKYSTKLPKSLEFIKYVKEKYNG